VKQIVNALEFGAGEFELLRFEQGYITRQVIIPFQGSNLVNEL
jgi:hypothetical protein